MVKTPIDVEAGAAFGSAGVLDVAVVLAEQKQIAGDLDILFAVLDDLVELFVIAVQIFLVPLQGNQPVGAFLGIQRVLRQVVEAQAVFELAVYVGQHVEGGDAFNRTPPKTQAALLQAMQEQQVTAGSTTHTLDQPFLVFATQNPIEHEGTYPLPEAQLDRFMFIINVTYPTRDQEVDIALSTTSGSQPELAVVMQAEDILELQKLVPRVPVSDHVAHFAVDLVQSSRPGNGATPVSLHQGAGLRQHHPGRRDQPHPA